MPGNPVYYDVAAILAGAGFGTLGADLFGAEWGPPDSQTLVLDGPGFTSDLPTLYEQPGVQILVRGAKREPDLIVYQRAKAIHDYLVSLPETVEVNGVCYKGFEPNSNIVALGKDENERHRRSMNFYTYRNGAEGP